MLYDRNFLLQLDRQKNKTVYAKVTSLTFDESPIESIEGKITQGSINIDGKSAVRRTCSLTILLDQYNYSDYSWSLKTKFKLEIGVNNTVNSNYPDIIWFNQGIFLLTNFNSSRATNNFTLSISGKDKMCLLNGDLGGNIEATTDFGQIEEEKDGEYIITKIDIQTILKNLLLTYAKEKAHNVIIKDLPEYGVELLEYRYDTPMYMYRLKNSNEYQNALMENKNNFVYKGENLFNFQNWAASDSNKIYGGNLSINQDNETIVVTSTSNDCYTLYGGQSSHYHIPITAGKSYIFSYNYSITGAPSAAPQAFVFFYKADGSAVNGVDISVPHIGKYDGSFISFVAPSGATKLGLRVGASSNDTTITFSNLSVVCSDTFEEVKLIDLKDKDFEWLTPTLTEDNKNINTPTELYVKVGNNFTGPYIFAKIKYGQTAGYRKTELTYPGDLISNPGETITSVLDKIKNMLGEFEYFYDLDGRFIFQKKKSSLKTISSSTTDIGIQLLDQQEAINYIFNDSDLFISINNSPNLVNIKNDYTIWGEKESSSGAKIPIHIRYAIDKKPSQYKSLSDIMYKKIANDSESCYSQKITLKSEQNYLLYTFNYQKEDSGAPILFNASEGTVYDIIQNNQNIKNYFCILYNGKNVFIHKDCFKQQNNKLTVKKLSSVTNNRKKYIYEFSSSGVTFNESASYRIGQDNDISGYYNIKRYSQGSTSLENVWINKNSCSFEILCDWREIIYQMAYDYFNYNHLETFEIDIAAANPTLYPTGKTGYEKYYTDIYSFWREIYNPDVEETRKDYYQLANDILEEIKVCQNEIKVLNETLDSGTTNYYATLTFTTRESALKDSALDIIGWSADQSVLISQDLIEVQTAFQSLCTPQEIKTNNAEAPEGTLKKLDDTLNSFYLATDEDFRLKQGWLKNVFTDPENIVFWFDFLDTFGELSTLNVSAIGQRTKVVKDTQVTNVFQRDTLNVLFGEADSNKGQVSGYSYIKINNEEEMFSISGRGKSCQDSLTELLNDQLSFSETVTLTTVPIYYLEPNTIIQINNTENKIFGNYNIDKITINLSHSGNTQIQGSSIKKDLFDKRFI